MIKNYFKIAFRNFGRHKLFTLINIVGLSIGISSALVIYLIVNYDFSFNRQIANGDRIYRVVTNYTFSGEPIYNSGVSGGLPAAAQSSVSGIASCAPFYVLNDPNVFIATKTGVPTQYKLQKDIVLADERFFSLFNYQWLAGSVKTAFNGPNQVVITDEQAKKYFPATSYNQILGKVVTYDTLATTVTGIVKPAMGNTDFTFQDFISYSSVHGNHALENELRLTDWGGTTSLSQLFLKLKPNVTAAYIEKQLNELLNKNNPPKPADKGNTRKFAMQPLNDIHFDAHYGVFKNSTVSKTTLYGLLAIGAFLLVLGCINFVNLTTAQSSQRAREIGVRKTMGSTRSQLIVQFLTETFLITLLSVLVAVVLCPVILMLFKSFISPGIRLDIFHQPDVILFLFALAVIVSLLSGFYPALVLSGFNPALVLKNQSASNGTKTRNSVLRKSLTVAQFVIAQFFIMATILVSKQIFYALHKDLGFKKDAIVIINTPWKNRTIGRNQVLMDKLRAIPQVQLVSIGRDAPSSNNITSTDASYNDGKHEIKVQLNEKQGDENYLKIYHLKLLAGRNIQPGDSSRAFIINNYYAKLLGFKNPQDAIGKTIIKFNGDKNMQIIGVIADFYTESLHTPVKPLAILEGTKLYDNYTFHLALTPQTAGGQEWKKAIASAQKAWKEVYPDDDFEYHFFDENIAKFYKKEQRVSSLLTWATGLSVFISCLGLLGLAMYTTNQRTKEIGVRKVLGASVTQIVALLSGELIWLIVLAFVLVTPLAWYAMNKWMQGFADRTTISWWIFALSGGGMLLAALCTLSFQTVKAAIANPVKSLRSE